MNGRSRMVVLLSLGVVSAYGALCVFVASRSLMTQAACPAAPRPPVDIQTEDVRFRSAAGDIMLAGWLTRQTADRAVIVLHGIDGYGWAGADAEIARAYATAGFRVLVLDQRAHGLSEGRRIALGALESDDIRSAVDLLRHRGIAAGRIAVHGTSFGAAMALLAASVVPDIGAVVADSSYADVRDVIAAQLVARLNLRQEVAGSLLGPGVQRAARWLYGIDLAALAPEQVVGAIAPRPILFIHGTHDPVTPVAHARRLFERAGPTSRLWLLEGLGHTQGVSLSPCTQVDSPFRQQFLHRVVTFVDSVLGPAAAEDAH